MRSKLKSFATAVLACTLIVALLLNQSAAAVGGAGEKSGAGAPDTLYVASVCTFSAGTKADAVTKCRAAGYIPVDADLNEGNDANAVILGYTTTDNPYEAITDLSVLEMNTGYETKDYSYIVEKQTEQLSKITAPLMASFDEYADNLRANSPAAVEAREILDLLYIPEMDNVPLGEYLASADREETFIKKLFCQANTGIMLTVINSMASGVADRTGDNWAQRLVGSPVHKQITAEEFDGQLDKDYEASAKDLRQPLHDFAENVNKALDFVARYGYDALKDKEEADTDEYEVPEEVIESITACEELEDRDAFAFYLMAYELLNTYAFADGRTVGDYLVTLGQKEYTSLDDIRSLYPLVASLTRGQFGVMRIVGIPQMALALTNHETKIAEAKNYTEKLKDSIAAFNKDGSERLSVWVGTDPIPYSSEIALTYQGIRETASAEEYSGLIAEKQKDKDLNYLMTSLSIGSTVIDSAVILATITINVVQIAKLGFYGWATAETAGMWALCAHAATAAGTGAIATILGYMGVALIIGTWVMTALTVLVLAYMLVDWVIDTFSDEDDVLEYTTDDIPIYVYDYRDAQYMRYDAVRDSGGAPCDLNAGEGKRFAALYYSKQDAAGEPIPVNPAGETFAVVHGDTLAPSGYRPVRYFGPGAAADLNAYSENKSAPSVYLSCYTGGTTPINGGTPSPAPAGQESTYLESLYVAAEKTETAAKDKLKKMGYTPIDRNLTSFYGEKGGLYTYLGYRTTALSSEAITDIRVVPQGISTGDSMAYGATTYVRAGEDIPATIPSIYYCKSAYAGTPVYADLQVVNSRSSAREGFEPVNLFCGGAAYNLNATGDSNSFPYSLSYANWNNTTGAYIYFHPSVVYTSGEQYVGGLAFFTGKNTSANSGNEIVQYAEKNGFTVWENDFAADYDLTFEIVRHVGKGKTTSKQTVGNIVTYLGYSTTYNPYRAICSVKSYTALSDAVTALNESIVAGRVTVPTEKGGTKILTTSYAACNVFYQFCGRVQEDDVKLSAFYRGVLSSNAWNGINEESGREILPDIAEYPAQSAEDYESYSWASSAPRLKNLYVSGSIPGMAPLTPEDILLTDSLENEDAYTGAGLYSVQDAKTPNRSDAHNIGFTAKHPLYLFVRGDKPHEKKYISALAVSSWNFDTAIGSDKAFQALDDDQKEELTEKYNRMKDDLCIVSALQSGTDEVILKNLAVGYGDSIQSSFGNRPSQAAYIGVSRTDNPLDAVHSIIKFKPANKAEATLTITVSGTEYIRAGSEPIHDKNGDYYLYYTTNTGCAPNEPITALDFSSVPLVKDCATALTATETDIQQRVVGGKVVREGRTGELKGYAGETNYIHAYFDTAKTYISDLYIGSGNTRDEAMIDLLNMGCNAFLDIDMNKGAGGKCVYIGYDRYYDRSSAAKYAVRDVLCTVGDGGAPTLEIDGVTYKRACDRYLFNGDRTRALSFNEGTNGFGIYLYYTSGTDNMPIMDLAAGEKDLIPDNAGKFVWENVMTTAGKRCNFNAGVFASENGHDRDTRIYMFAHRIDNSVKDSAGIVCGVPWNTMTYGKLVLQ